MKLIGSPAVVVTQHTKKTRRRKMFAPYDDDDDDGSHLNVIGYFSHTYIGSEDVAECG